ncbi:efflux RND transporter permease subunit [candidate division KSB1 bacterium]
MRISRYAIDYPITISMVIISLLVLGYLSLQRLPLQFMPDFSPPSMMVMATYQSSSPEEIEDQISRPLEEFLSTLPHLETIDATSTGQQARIHLEFEQDTDMDMMAMEVRERIDRAKQELPTDLERVYIRRFQMGDRPVFFFSLSSPEGGDELYYLFTHMIQPKLERIDGVANVDVRGMWQRQIIVDLDESLLQASGIDAFEVAQAIQSNNVNRSAGVVRETDRRYSLRVLGEFRSVDEIAAIPVGRHGLRLRNLADVRFDYPARRSFQRLNLKDAVSIQINKESTANVVDVCRRLRAALTDLKTDPKLAEIDFHIYSDQSEEIIRGVTDLKTAGLFGGLVAVLILFAFLRQPRSTLIISLAIPVALVCTFTLMYLLRQLFGLEISLNIISMSGLILGIGMLVDPGVVVLESIFRNRELGTMSPRSAAIQGTQQVGMAVVASNLTTITVFVPLVFMGGGFMGRFMKDFGITLAIALISSLFIALTLVPMMSAKLYRKGKFGKPKSIVWLIDNYGRLLNWTLNHRLLLLVVVVALLFASLSLFRNIDRAFMSPSPSRQIDISVELDRSFDVDRVDKIFTNLENTFSSLSDSLEITTISSNFNTRRSSLTLHLSEDDNARRSTVDITNDVRAILPVIPGVVFTIGRRHHRGGGSGGIEVRLKGEDGRLLKLMAEEVKERIRDLPDIKDIDTDLETGDDEIGIVLNRERTLSHGLNSRRVAQSISTALGSRASSKFKAADREVDITLQLKESDRLTLDQLKNIKVTGTGAARQAAAGGRTATTGGSQMTTSDGSGTLRTQGSGTGSALSGNVMTTAGAASGAQTTQRTSGESGPTAAAGGTAPSSPTTGVSLGSLASFVGQRAPTSLRRENRQRIIQVHANVDRSGILFLTQTIQDRLSDLELPSGYTWEMGSNWRMMRESEASSIFALLLAVLFIYMIMAALFESFSHPFTILFSIPFAMIGVALALRLTGTSLDNMAWLGIIILVGIVVNNGIILIDRINQIRREGTSRREAIIEGGRNRIRPILMTAFTTMGGLLPMALPILLPSLFQTAGGRFAYGPVALPVIGGLLTATFLTLVVLPTIYSVVDDIEIWLKAVVRRSMGSA